MEDILATAGRLDAYVVNLGPTPGFKAQPADLSNTGFLREAFDMDYPRALINPEPGWFSNEKALTDYVLGALSEWFVIQTEVPGRYRDGQRPRLDAVLSPVDRAVWADDDPVFGVEFKVPTLDTGERDYFAWAAQAVDYAHCDWDGYGRLQIFVCPSPIMAIWGRGRRVPWQAAAPGDGPPGCGDGAELPAGRLGPDSVIDEVREWRRQDTHPYSVRKQREEDALARLEGFTDALDRSVEQSAVTGKALMHLLGQLNVGELTLVRDHGWCLIRSGHMLWCSHCGVRNRWTLKPRFASRS